MPTRRNFISIISTLLVVTVLFSGCSPTAKKARIHERADRYFQAGEYDKAKIEYLNLLRLEQNVTAFQQLGFIWSEQGVPLRAIPFLLKVRELAPQNIAARSKLARAFMTLGQPAEARKEALSILQQDPGNSDAIILIAESSQSKEEIAAAEQELEKFPQKNTAAFHLAAGSLALRKGDVGAASGEIQQALAVEPKSARAHLVLGYVYMLRKNPGHAGPELKIASELAPVRSEERIKYAEFQAANGASDEAKVLLQGITKQAPDYVPAWRDLAQIALTEKKYDEALSFLENIFSRDPDNPDVRVLQAMVLLAKGDSAKALAILDKLNTAYPNNPLLKYQLARAYVFGKNPVQATAALEQAITAKPDYAEAILLLGELNFRAGKAQPVVIAMEDLRKKRPDLPQARVLLANAYQALGRPEEAASLFREQTKIAPESADGYFFLGLVLRQQKKNDEARQAFEKASELSPDNLNPIDQLVDLDVFGKKYDAAMQKVQQQLQKTPQSAGAHFMEGKIYAAQGKWDQAEAAIEKAIELDANFRAAYELLVSVYVAANKLPKAISQLEAILTKNPNDPTALATLAVVYEKMKDYSKASDNYEKLLVLKPDFAMGLNNLAVLYAGPLNRLDRAYELAQKARTLQPNDGSIADTLGWILYKRDDYQQALALLQESASKFPENPEVQFHLGMTSYMMGQADAARPAFERAAHATTDFPGKDEAKRRLALLEVSAVQKLEVPIDELEGLLKQQPNDVVVLDRLGEAYEKRGDAAKAATAYEQALKLNPKLLPATLKLAQLYAGQLHNKDKALELAKKARELAPNDPQTAGVVGRTAFQAGNFSWAYSLLQESARKGSNDPGVLHDLAVAAYALGKVAEAREAMQRLTPEAAQFDNAKRFLAMTALEQPSAEVVAAEPEIQKILKVEQDYTPALMAQAAIHLRRNDAGAAAGIYLQVLQKYPDFAPAQKRLATIYADEPGNLVKAYDLAMKARKTLPEDPELARTLAQLNFKRKEFSYAIQLFEQSAAKEPLVAQDLYYLAVAQLETKQEAKGRETLDRALKAGLSGSLAEDARKRLAEQPK